MSEPPQRPREVTETVLLDGLPRAGAARGGAPSRPPRIGSRGGVRGPGFPTSRGDGAAGREGG